MKGKAALLFVNKKKQKNFVNLGPCGFNASGPAKQKFLRRFFQKAAAFFLLLFALPAAAQAPSTPTGRWLTANRQAVIQVEPCGTNFCGRIIGIIVLHAGDPLPLDWLGRPQCGFIMLRTKRQIGTEPRWAGSIQDPRDGDTYRRHHCDEAGWQAAPARLCRRAAVRRDPTLGALHWVKPSRIAACRETIRNG